MANVKITGLTALGGDAASGDLLEITDVSGPNVSRKVTAAELVNTALVTTAFPHFTGEDNDATPTASGTNSLASGVGAVARETDNIAIGSSSSAGQTSTGTTEQDAVAIGTVATANESDCVAIGNSATAGLSGTSIDPASIAIGRGADAQQAQSIAIGARTSALGTNAIALGGDGTTGAQATADDAIAIGTATASAANAVAIGNGSSEAQASCVALDGLTGALTPPVGTTAQVPGTPRNGMMRYDSTTNKLVVRINGAWHNVDTTAV